MSLVQLVPLISSSSTHFGTAPFFYRIDVLPATQPPVKSKHWREHKTLTLTEEPVIWTYPYFSHHQTPNRRGVAPSCCFSNRISLLARLMGQYCFAGWRLSSLSVMLPACGPAGHQAHGNAACAPAAKRVGSRAADTARRASTVTSH